MPRFLIHETGIHLIDVFRYLLGEITGVFARLRRINPVIKGEDAGLRDLRFRQRRGRACSTATAMSTTPPRTRA